MSSPLTCREFVTFLDDYLAGALDRERVAAFNEHLANCPACVAYMNSYRESVRLGRAALAPTDEPTPADVPEGLLRAILAARDKKP